MSLSRKSKSSCVPPGVDVHTTRGAEHIKHWVQTEARRAHRAALVPNGAPTEELHTMAPKPLWALRSLTESQKRAATPARPEPPAAPVRAAPSGAANPFDMRPPMLASTRTLAPKKLPPHQAHHHHFGWGEPQEENIDQTGTVHYKAYGSALGYCQSIHAQSSLINTRDQPEAGGWSGSGMSSG
mmetsp:Transcript_7868/g.26127  ORF Transcript_7868/g.26127 Transcript_7868/m.26127 type:complete len:184 (-) Transcript_7868:51-602(-)|eukprot:CAMPEP_0170151754 /NCGR_PEP_ID=MMETSP0033_2-20121228/50478_1 /TAXON_ID=195969 /ORGANISM="Dolichomastix tenuilepis, Strain CCMP3274" /LENGTH=183 /DNA_ID=CAMNT_0010388861 /DNA_START=108 /DNA_END=659 /DNA_ORIENTATION=-